MSGYNLSYQRLEPCSVYRSNQCTEIGGEQFHRYRHQNHAEEFTENVGTALSQQPFHHIEIPQNKIDNDQVEKHRHDDIDCVILRPHGEQGGKTPGTGNQGKHDRKEGG